LFVWRCGVAVSYVVVVVVVVVVFVVVKAKPIKGTARRGDKI
jgi:hypothetical protein